MDSGNGDIYPSIQDAIKAGVKKPVEILGSQTAIAAISKAVRKNAKTKRKAKKKARKINHAN